MADKQFSQKPWLIPLLAIAGVIVFGALVTGVFYFSQQQVAPLRSRIEALDRIKPNNFPELEKLAQQQKALIDAENAVRAPLIQAMVGVLATIATSTAAFIAFQNYRATQEKNTADRFSKAVEQLGNENIHVRLGGIFALEQIANTEDKYYWQIMEILTAYVRERSPSSSSSEKISEDIQAVMTVLSRRKDNDNKGGNQLNLRDTNLRQLRLPPEARLKGINLSYSDLRDAILPNINLDDAILTKATLINVILDGSSLNNCSLRGADCRYASFRETSLRNANLRYAVFVGVSFNNADLEEANIYARLNRCTFDGANLKGIKYLPPKNPEPWETSAYGFEPLSDEQNQILHGLFGPSQLSPSSASKT
jgi:hypothetical protein